VEENIATQAAPIRALYPRAREAWQRQHVGQSNALDRLWLLLGRKLIFAKVKERFGPNLRALICGSAPLAPQTQEFFLMLGIPVLQAYGLTETTALCTLDDPRLPVEPGFVGPAITGVEMKLAENDEIVVRGPNIFSGYWNRPEETAKVLQHGWFHSGDQGEVNERGNWRIIGRIKNLLVLNTGHKFAPEPIEDKLAQLLPAAQQIVLVGNGRSYVCMLVAGNVESNAVQAAIDSINSDLPHYRQIRNFKILQDSFTAESGLLTAMGKIKRETIAKRYDAEINSMYERKASA
jgi:long-chain acyl-CoA synthetase